MQQLIRSDSGCIWFVQRVDFPHTIKRDTPLYSTDALYTHKEKNAGHPFFSIDLFTFLRDDHRLVFIDKLSIIYSTHG